MIRNPLLVAAHADCHGDKECCRYNFCKECGSHVSGYNGNASLIDQRPECVHDWWVACDNALCKNAYGEGIFQGLPDWVERKYE